MLKCRKSIHALPPLPQTSSFPTQAETVAGFFGDGADLYFDDVVHGFGRDQFAGESFVWGFWIDDWGVGDCGDYQQDRAEEAGCAAGVFGLCRRGGSGECAV